MTVYNKALDDLSRIRQATMQLAARMTSGEKIRLTTPPDDWGPNPFNAGDWKLAKPSRTNSIGAAVERIPAGSKIGPLYHDVGKSIKVLTGRCVMLHGPDIVEIGPGETIDVPSFLQHEGRYPVDSTILVEWYLEA